MSYQHNFKTIKSQKHTTIKIYNTLVNQYSYMGVKTEQDKIRITDAEMKSWELQSTPGETIKKTC
jgi:hypothetical protein